MRDSFDRRLDERLAGLVAATSDSARIERVRARCHAVLGDGGRPANTHPDARQFVGRGKGVS